MFVGLGPVICIDPHYNHIPKLTSSRYNLSMAFPLPDLIIEAAIRDGIANIKASPSLLDAVFSELESAYASRKYGASEITQIKDLITGVNGKEIAIVHAYHLAVAKTPSFSIQLGSDTESDKFLNDYQGQLETSITPEVKVASFVPTFYDDVSGQIAVADGVDLSNVYPNFVFVDASGIPHVILRGISDETGEKFFFVAEDSVVDIGGNCRIESFIDTSIAELKGSLHDIQILIGVHSVEPLLTKYLYILLKYILKSRRHDLERNCLTVSSMSGSDFTQNQGFQGDHVFDRFLTVTGKVEESWNSDDVTLIENVVIDAELCEAT